MMTYLKNGWAWIKRQAKKVKTWVVVTVLGGTALALNLAGIPPQTFDTESSLLTEISKVQQDAVSKTGKYERTKPRSGLDFEIHEYVSPKGPGYQVVFFRYIDGPLVLVSSESSDLVVSKVQQTKSVGYGPEASWRNHDWE